MPIFAPILMLFARFLLALLFQGLLALVFYLRGEAAPFQSAAPWWTVYGTLIDLACLLAIGFFMHREGLRLSTLIDFNRKLFWKDLSLVFPLLILFLMLGFGGGTLAGLLIYGGAPPAPMGGLPLWGTLFSILIWPLVWGISEQLTYLGYTCPACKP